MPYFDVKPGHPHFASMQRIGATGILKGRGEPWQWANRTWFRPDSLVSVSEIREGLQDIMPAATEGVPEGTLKLGDAVLLAERLASAGAPATGKSGGKSRPLPLAGQEAEWAGWGLADFRSDRPVTRLELSVILDRLADPFGRWAVDHKGDILTHNR
jgi:hypothetical protein